MPRHDDVGRERDALGLDLIVFLIEKSLLTVVASGDGVIKSSSNVDAWRTRHDLSPSLQVRSQSISAQQHVAVA